MKALAASSIGQYERSVRAPADYNRTVELGLVADHALETLAALPGNTSKGAYGTPPKYLLDPVTAGSLDCRWPQRSSGTMPPPRS
jgi:hypothetical protein